MPGKIRSKVSKLAGESTKTSDDKGVQSDLSPSLDEADLSATGRTLRGVSPDVMLENGLAFLFTKSLRQIIVERHRDLNLNANELSLPNVDNKVYLGLF